MRRLISDRVRIVEIVRALKEAINEFESLRAEPTSFFIEAIDSLHRVKSIRCITNPNELIH